MAKVLVVGSGGREHALVRALVDDNGVHEVVCAPGNGGTAATRGARNLEFRDYNELYRIVREEGIELTVVGPEGPLAEGLVDLFRGVKVFGFDRATAQLEASKVIAKEFMRRHGIPTPDFEVFGDYDKALDYLKPRLRAGEKFFIKADELCGGKGSLPANDLEEAERALRFLLKERGCGRGERVVIERALEGEEVTIMAIVDPRGNYVLTPPTQDHKRAYDNDQGPNTGGMGAYAPAPLITSGLQERITERIIEPTLRGMEEEGLGGAGVLYFGLMVSAGEPYILEYNVRFGDPEAQAALPLLRGDLYPVLSAAVEEELDKVKVEWEEKAAVCVVLATEGYPVDYGREREEIEGIAEAEAMEDVIVYHAGTELRDGKFYTHGGRILGVTGIGETIAAARKRAYEAVERIYFGGMRYRRDIAARALR
jgi:phosphoribosylamine--glycine ligase